MMAQGSTKNCMALGITQPFTNTTRGVVNAKQNSFTDNHKDYCGQN